MLALSEEGYSLRVIAVHVGLRTHKDWTAEQWSEVIFSDESSFLFHRSDERVSGGWRGRNLWKIAFNQQ